MRVFISHHSSDREAAQSIASACALEADVFIDSTGLISGTPWAPRIESELRQASVILVLLGSSGIGAIQRQEIMLARMYRKQFVILTLPMAQLPPAGDPLAELTYVPWTESGGLETVRQAIQHPQTVKWAGGPVRRNQRSLRNPELRRRLRQAAIGLLAAVLIAGPAVGLSTSIVSFASMRWILAKPEGVTPGLVTIGILSALVTVIVAWVREADWIDVLLRNRLPVAPGSEATEPRIAVVAIESQRIWAQPYIDALRTVGEEPTIVWESADGPVVSRTPPPDPNLGEQPEAQGSTSEPPGPSEVGAGPDSFTEYGAALRAADAVVLIWASPDDPAPDPQHSREPSPPPEEPKRSRFASLYSRMCTLVVRIGGSPYRPTTVAAALDWAAKNPEKPFLHVGPSNSRGPSYGGWEARVEGDDPAEVAQQTVRRLLSRSISRAGGWRHRSESIRWAWIWTLGALLAMAIQFAALVHEQFGDGQASIWDAFAIGEAAGLESSPAAWEARDRLLQEIATYHNNVVSGTFPSGDSWSELSVWAPVFVGKNQCYCEIHGRSDRTGPPTCMAVDGEDNGIATCAAAGYVVTWDGTEGTKYSAGGESVGTCSFDPGVRKSTGMICVPIAPRNDETVDGSTLARGVLCLSESAQSNRDYLDRRLHRLMLNTAVSFASLPLLELTVPAEYDACKERLAGRSDVTAQNDAIEPVDAGPVEVRPETADARDSLGTSDAPNQLSLGPNFVWPHDPNLSQWLIGVADRSYRRVTNSPNLDALMRLSEAVTAAIRVEHPGVAELRYWAPDGNQICQIDAPITKCLSIERSIAGCAFRNVEVVYWDLREGIGAVNQPAKVVVPIGLFSHNGSGQCSYQGVDGTAQVLCVPVGLVRDEGDSDHFGALGAACIEGNEISPDLAWNGAWRAVLVHAQVGALLSWDGLFEGSVVDVAGATPAR